MIRSIKGVEVGFVGDRRREKKALELLSEAVSNLGDDHQVKSIHYQITLHEPDQYNGFVKEYSYSVNIGFEMDPLSLDPDKMFKDGKKSSYLFVRSYSIDRVLKAFGKNFQQNGLNIVWHEGRVPKIEASFQKMLKA